MSFDPTQPLPPLRGRERSVFWAVAAVCAVSRLATRARSLWDWDETLFCLGMRSFDVSQHHPHPPGFPMYIGFGRLVRLVIHDDFRALQTINLAAGVVLFPAVFMLARELRLRFPAAVIAGALCAFFPNVWFFGGTAFSDVVSIVLVVAAVAFLLRGCRSNGAFLIGTLLLALAAGIRPQNFAIGAVPGLIATWYRVRAAWRVVLLATVIGATVVLTAFGAAIHATGSFQRYLSSVRAHGEYISRVDSFHNPDRPPLWRLFDRFFIKQYDNTPLSIAVSLFVAVSIAGSIRERNRAMLVNLLAFGPFAISAWLMLDRFSISRFSIGYIPMFAIFAADGIARAARQRPAIEAAIGGVLILGFILWAFRSFAVVRHLDSPPVQAVNAVRNLDPSRDDLYVAVALHPFMQVLAADRTYIEVLDERALPLSIGSRRPWLLADIQRTNGGGYFFHRRHDALWNIARRQYFDVALKPMTRQAEFVSGWYPAERSGTDERRSMAGHSVSRLPAQSGGAVLRLEGDFPTELLPRKPTVTIALNGAILDRFVPATGHYQRDFSVVPPRSTTSTLEIVVDPADAGGTRPVGFTLRFLAWGAR